MIRLFNPQPRVQLLQPAPGLRCVVLDDVLLEPETLVQYAASQRFEAPEGNFYPGLVAAVSEEFSQRLRDLFWQHARGPLALRRCQAVYTRLALTTTAVAQLQPLQWLCHRDRISDDAPDEMFAASVLYLFRDPAMGGTRFFAPRRPAAEVAELLRDAEVLGPEAFSARHGIAPGYPAAGSAHFDCVATVPAAWNRMIIYDGGGYHSAAIDHPELLSSDPATGRLTVNGFFPCRRQNAASRHP